MTKSDILNIVLAKTSMDIIRILPRTKRTAKSIQQLSKACNIPRTTLYRNIKPLLEWDNIGQVIKTGKSNYELFIYLKHNFQISFDDGITKLQLKDGGLE